MKTNKSYGIALTKKIKLPINMKYSLLRRDRHTHILHLRKAYILIKTMSRNYLTQ